MQDRESIQQNPAELSTIDSLNMNSPTGTPFDINSDAVKQSDSLHDGRQNSVNKPTLGPSLFGHPPASERIIEVPNANEKNDSLPMEPKSLSKLKLPMPPPKQFTIQLGDKIFTLCAQTVEKYCKKLANQFCSSRWNSELLEKTEEGFYHLQGDPDMFEYLQSYMVSGTFPLFFFDHLRGNKIVHEINGDGRIPPYLHILVLT